MGRNLTHYLRARRREAIANDLKNGLTFKEIAAKYDMSNSHIAAISREHGVRCGTRMLSPNTYEIIRDLIKTDWPMSYIAEQHKVTRQRVGQINKCCVDAGVPVRERLSSNVTT